MTETVHRLALASPPSFAELADGVFAFLQPPGGWCLNNAGVVVGTQSTVVVDTAATERRALRLRAEVERVSPAGADLVVNTHFHGDHTFGNALFVPRSTVVAHADTRRDAHDSGLDMRRLWPDVDWGTPPLTLPTLTFRDSLTLHTGGPRVELLHLGAAHTAADVAAWVPERGVLFAGDAVWSGVTPYFLMGSVTGSLAALDRLRELRPRTVVPGHGPVGGPELLDRTAAYVRWVRELAEDADREGLAPLAAARRAGLGAFGALLDSERLVGNLHRALAELHGLPPGDRLDVTRSFREMVEFNGALPVCHA